MKKIPPWAWVGGAIVLGALLWLYKKRKEDQAALEANEPETASGAPEVEQYPYGIGGYPGEGGGGAGGGAIGNALETQSQLRELFGESEKRRLESEGNQLNIERQIQESITRNQQALEAATAAGRQSTITQGSGGGAPENTRPGTTAAPATPGATCGHGKFGEYPLGSAPNCYRVSREKSGGGCACHAHYGSNHLDCEVGSAKNHTCHF